MIKLKQIFSADLKPAEDSEDEVGVGVGVGVLTLVAVDREDSEAWVVVGVEEVEGPTVDWVIDWAGREVVLETVGVEDTNEESVRLGFCPGYVSSGSCVPLTLHSLTSSMDTDYEY